MSTTIKSLVLAFFLAQAAQGKKDHSSHNCCVNNGSGWFPSPHLPEKVCADYYQGVGIYQGITCVQAANSSIDGDDFLSSCKKAAGPNYKGEVGAGYRGTCGS